MQSLLKRLRSVTSLGEHDDLVDSMTQAVMRFRQGGFVEHPEDYEDESVTRTEDVLLMAIDKSIDTKKTQVERTKMLWQCHKSFKKVAR